MDLSSIFWFSSYTVNFQPLIRIFNPEQAVVDTLKKAGSKAFPVEPAEPEPEYRRKTISFVSGDPDAGPEGDGWVDAEAKKSYYAGGTKVAEKFTEKWYEDQKNDKEQESAEANAGEPVAVEAVQE